MLLRVLGIGLLVLVSIPLIIAFPPLAAVPLLFLFLRSRATPRSSRRRRPTRRLLPGLFSTRKASRRGRPRSARRSSRGRLLPARGALALFIGGLVGLALLRAQFEQYPQEVTILVLLGLVLLAVAWRKRQPATPPAWVGAGGHGSGMSLPTVAAGTEFEWHVVDLLRSLGYRAVNRVGGSGDNGIDIVAEDKRGQTFLVQCKRFNPGNKVGSVDIQKLLGAVVHHGADGGLFFTTSAYTPTAMALARSGRVPITLYDGRDVARLSP